MTIGRSLVAIHSTLDGLEHPVGSDRPFDSHKRRPECPAESPVGADGKRSAAGNDRWIKSAAIAIVAPTNFASNNFAVVGGESVELAFRWDVAAAAGLLATSCSKRNRLRRNL